MALPGAFADRRIWCHFSDVLQTYGLTGQECDGAFRRLEHISHVAIHVKFIEPKLRPTMDCPSGTTYHGAAPNASHCFAEGRSTPPDASIG